MKKFESTEKGGRIHTTEPDDERSRVWHGATRRAEPVGGYTTCSTYRVDRAGDHPASHELTRDGYKRLPSCVCDRETDDPTISDICLHGDRSPPRRSDESCDVSEFVVVSIRPILSTRVHGTPLSRLRLDIVSVRSPREMSRNFFAHNRLQITGACFSSLKRLRSRVPHDGNAHPDRQSLASVVHLPPAQTHFSER